MTLNSYLSSKTAFFGLRLWVLIGIGVGAFIVFILFLLSIWLASSRKQQQQQHRPNLRSSSSSNPCAAKLTPLTISTSPAARIPAVSKEIKEVVVPPPSGDGGVLLTISDRAASNPKDKVYVHVGFNRGVGVEMGGRRHRSSSAGSIEIDSATPARCSSLEIVRMNNPSSSQQQQQQHSNGSSSSLSATPSRGVPELGWGYWFTLRELEAATAGFAPDNVLGEGGYGIVYRGCLPDGTMVAVKSLLNNRGQAEKEFRVEVEAIGRVRHKNLVRLLGYCVEGNYRMLVYEFVDNGNLEQWLHGPASILNSPTWEARIKIALGTAKALAYLHEALEPKVVHRDIKASNILLDAHWGAKISDFGLAKMLGSDNSHIKTRVMGTFGYVAPEYANTGLLNERSDVYSFGVLLMEIITGRDPVDYGRPSGEVNLVDWVKQMVASRQSDEVADPRLEARPSGRALKKALLVALRCVDPDATKRPKMGTVVHMLEMEELAAREPQRDDVASSS